MGPTQKMVDLIRILLFSGVFLCRACCVVVMQAAPTGLVNA